MREDTRPTLLSVGPLPPGEGAGEGLSPSASSLALSMSQGLAAYPAYLRASQRVASHIPANSAAISTPSRSTASNQNCSGNIRIR